jgi:putative transposase
MKNDLKLSVGSEVLYQEHPHTIKAHLSLTTFLLINKTTGAETTADLSAISVINYGLPNVPIVDQGTIRLSNDAWKEAERRASVIRPLADMSVVTTSIANEAAEQLNLSQRTIYILIRRFRESGGLLTSIAPNVSSGGRGKSRLSPLIDQIITMTINELYLSKQKHTAENVAHEVRRRCIRAKLNPPSFNTVRERIRILSVRESITRREGSASAAARQLTAIEGNFPEVKAPLDLIQIDHTPVDLIIVDEINRRPIGRPYLTASIDSFSRCITGFCLTFEAPSAVSVGLCLVHSVIDKSAYLTQLSIAGEWPIWGKPLAMYVDNGAEFHSEALRRGCAQHGIELHYRPPGAPQYGGIIERLIGTLMQHVHTIPGTTFSNIMQRGEYDSDGKAILTLSELEKWLTLVIIGHYHNKIHATLHEPPIERYKTGVLNSTGPKPVVQNKKGFLIDFLPIVKRSIQRHGFMIDHINYYSNALQPWIAERNQGEKFIIRRDPRDISRIYVLPPKQNEYIEVPYRTLQCYTLDKIIAEKKFGPSYVVFKTPITNIRICTYFSGESEVKILSLDKLIPVQSYQCEFNSENITIV